MAVRRRRTRRPDHGRHGAGCWEAIDDTLPASRHPGRLLGRLIAGALHAPPAPGQTAALILCGTGYNPGKEFTAPHQAIPSAASVTAGTTPSRISARRSARLRSRLLRRHVRRAQCARRRADDHPPVRGPGQSRTPTDHHSRVACPTIILTGSEDGTHPAAFALKERIPNCEMRILDGAGHACQIEQPWLFDRYMIEFLDRPWPVAVRCIDALALRVVSLSPSPRQCRQSSLA